MSVIVPVPGSIVPSRSPEAILRISIESSLFLTAASSPCRSRTIAAVAPASPIRRGLSGLAGAWIPARDQSAGPRGDQGSAVGSEGQPTR